VLKIYQIFILKFLLLFVGTIFLSSIIIYISLKDIIIEHNKNNLKNAIILMELELDKVDELDSYVAQVHKQTSLRVTIIDKDGVVIGESNTDKSTMQNHANRYEVMHSNKDEFAHVTRYSKTLKVDFLYVVHKTLYKNQPIYLRLSMSLSQVMRDYYSLWSKLATAFVFMILIAFYISKLMSHRIIYDIEQITSYLDEISSKNYRAVIKTKYFYEFLQISLMHKNLVKKLTTREKQKRKYTAKLRLMNKQRNDILSAISHEFKNPVASIIGYAQTLEEDPDISPKIRAKFLEKISSNGDKISKMLDRLALSVKLENSDIEIKESLFDLKSLAEEVMANLSLKYKERELIVKGESTLINADKTMIELVLINLIDNALKYSQSDVTLFIDDTHVRVIDRGIGIKEDEISKITGKFYRVQKNSWDNSMGIGLAMVSYILRAHHSSLEIESVYAQGSTFSFNIQAMMKS